MSKVTVTSSDGSYRNEETNEAEVFSISALYAELE
jgi:hypothetical protein